LKGEQSEELSRMKALVTETAKENEARLKAALQVCCCGGRYDCNDWNVNFSFFVFVDFFFHLFLQL
jgi:hypothetical protein